MHAFYIFGYSLWFNLVRERKTAHTGLDAQHVVVHREHAHDATGVESILGGNLDLRVVDAREVAGASGLVVLRLEGERVRIHTTHGVTRVVVVGLHLVEVRAGLLLEAILTVEDELESLEGTAGDRRSRFRLLHDGTVRVGTADQDLGSTHLTGRHVVLARRGGGQVDHNVRVRHVGGEVPQLVTLFVRARRLGVVEAPHQLLDWVVVRQAHLLSRGGVTDAVRTSVLHLLDQVLVTLLGEATALVGVKVHVVTPHLHTRGREVARELSRQVNVEAHLVVLETDEGQVETGVAVEEEDQWQDHTVGAGHHVRGHLTPVSLLGLVEVELGVQAPPALVVLVNALTADGQLNVLDGTLGSPALVETRRGRYGHEVQVHVADQITVAGNGDRKTTRVTGGAVHDLLDVLHREVSVALVDRLEESNLGVTGEVDILGTVGNELHETTRHCSLLYTNARFFFGAANA